MNHAHLVHQALSSPSGSTSASHFLQLGLGRLNSWDEQVAHVTSSFVEEEAHPLTAETLGNDVEVNAAIIYRWSVVLGKKKEK